jgi:hypothetical protein
VAAGAAAAVIAATGGVLVLSSDTARTGDPAPFRIKGFYPASGKPITTADPIASSTAVVTARVRLPAGARKPGDRRSLTLSCPPGMKVAGFQALERPHEATVVLLCRRPDAIGSIVANPRLPRHGETPGRVCANTEYLRRSAGAHLRRHRLPRTAAVDPALQRFEEMGARHHGCPPRGVDTGERALSLSAGRGRSARPSGAQRGRRPRSRASVVSEPAALVRHSKR